MSTLRASLIAMLFAITACGGGGSSGGSSVSNTFSVSGPVTGLIGSGLVVRANSTNVAISSTDTVTLLSGLTNGASYNVTVTTQPSDPSQICTVANGSGTISSSSVTNVAIACVMSPLTLTSSTPVSGSTGEARDVAAILTFSALIESLTAVHGNVSLQSAAGEHPFTLAVLGKDLQVIPSKRFLPLQSYTLTVGTGLRGLRGEVLASPVTITFSITDSQWKAAARVPTGAAGGVNPQIAFDASGAAIAVYEQADGISINIGSSRYVPFAGWGTPEIIDNVVDAAIDPQIATDAFGNALAVWNQFNGSALDINANRYIAGVGWAIPETIESEAGDTFTPQIAIDPSGVGVAVWGQIDILSFITTSRYTNVWDVVRRTASDDTGNSTEPQVVVDANGNALLIWTQQQLNRVNILASRAPPGGEWSQPVLLETNFRPAARPQIAVDSGGNALAVWRQNDGTRNSIWSNRYTAGGSWGTATRIETDDAGDADDPQIAFDANGNALAVWQQHDGQRNRIWSNRYTAGSGWGTAAPIATSTDPGSSAFPQIVIDSRGNALAVWSESDGMNGFVLASRYIAGEGWKAGTRISPNEIAVLEPQVAVDAEGNALAIWARQFTPPSGGGSFEIWSSRFD